MCGDLIQVWEIEALPKDNDRSAELTVQAGDSMELNHIVLLQTCRIC